MIFIAEIGLNYNGNMGLAYEMIKCAKQSGADIAKFQCGWRDKENEINHFTIDSLKKIKDWCDYFEIEFLSSVFHQEAYELVKKVKPRRYKIASRTLAQNYEFVKKVVEENENSIISCGMWDTEKGMPFDGKKVSYLWCKSEYPHFPSPANNFPKYFPHTPFIGYSDHSIGIEMCLLAIARGATIIEKHFTLDKSSSVIRDHALSATPDEFYTLVNLGRDINKKVSAGI